MSSEDRYTCIEPYRDLYPFQPNLFEVSEGKIHYVDVGPKNAPTILFVHGNPTWSFYYRNLIQALRTDYRCVAIDHLGCGLSDKPQRYNYCLSNHISNLHNLIDHLNISKYHLVVHDWGGMIGFGLATDAPEKAQSFFILNTCAFRLPHKNNFPLRIAACRVPLLGRVATRIFNGFSRGASLMASISPENTRREKDGLMAPYDNYRNRIAVHQFVKDIPLKNKHQSWKRLVGIEEKLHLFKDKPKQIVWGKQDFCFDDYFLAEWRRFFPDIAIHEIHNAGHYVLEDSREEVIDKAVDFFQNQA
tara:strand:+ start:286 stop:1194 length:909 start_codon:yes stop_codon:yes gene_type:complete